MAITHDRVFAHCPRIFGWIGRIWRPARRCAAAAIAGAFAVHGLCLSAAAFEPSQDVLAAANGAALQEVLDKNSAQRPAVETRAKALGLAVISVRVGPKGNDTERLFVAGGGKGFTDCATGEACPEMTVIPASPPGFAIGSPPEEDGHQEDEKLQAVNVRPFAIGRFEVTVGEYKRCVAVRRPTQSGSPSPRGRATGCLRRQSGSWRPAPVRGAPIGGETIRARMARSGPAAGNAGANGTARRRRPLTLFLQIPGVSTMFTAMYGSGLPISIVRTMRRGLLTAARASRTIAQRVADRASGSCAVGPCSTKRR